MHEDNLMRLLIIGVTLFVFIFTVTTIILYYNSAVNVSEAALEGTVDFGTMHESDLKELEGKEIKGTELINIIKNISSDINVTIGYESNDYTMFRDTVLGNIREGNLGVIKKAVRYKIIHINLYENNLKIDIVKKQ